MYHKLILLFILWSPLILLITFYILPFSSPDHPSPITQPKIAKQWLILYWTPIFGTYKHWGPGPKCTSCYGTTNREFLNISDVVYFHYRDLNEDDLPKFRKPNQIYICMNMESPVNNGGINVSRYKYFFNWTADYRHDSNLFYPYGRVYVHDNNLKHTIKKPWLVDNNDFKIPKPDISTIEKATANFNKTRSIAWIVSHCKTGIKREDYVKNLSSFIDVDIYGACGKLKCPRSADCMKMIENKYMFYIAFENSLCLDYITEKLYKVLQFFIVPIVMGGGHYESAAPPKSYINVQDYQSPEDLAKYLRYLQENRHAYNQYFEWKKYFTVTNFAIEEFRIRGKFGICAECAAIKNHLTLKKSSIIDLEEFYDMKQCRSKL